MMSRVQKGMVAGLAATVSVSALELGNLAMGSPVMAFPAFIAEVLGLQGNLMVGWMVHLAIGVLVLGSGFGFLYAKLPTSTSATRGIVYAVGPLPCCWSGSSWSAIPGYSRGRTGSALSHGCW